MPVTNYLWDPETDTVLLETDGNNAVQVVYTTEPVPYGNLISQHRDGATSYYHQDALGSTLALTDEDENVTDEYVYSAYGETVAQTGTTVNPFRWLGAVGYYFDQGTGDYYVRARNYSPRQGRWTSFDPLAQSALTIVDAFGYGRRSPVTTVDPSGLIGTPPGSSFTEEQCNIWRAQCKSDCLSEGGTTLGLINAIGIRCLNACDIAADVCIERAVQRSDAATDLRLSSELISSCCDKLPFWKRAECHYEVEQIMAALAKARQEIYERGGPATFDFAGAVCTDCQQIVRESLEYLRRYEDALGSRLKHYFRYSHRIYDQSGPMGDHEWGEITCISTGEPLVTIDFWKGCRDYWRRGRDSFGYTANQL